MTRWKPVDELIAEQVRDDFKNTHKSKRALSKEYDLSYYMISKIVEGITKDKIGVIRREFEERDFKLISKAYVHAKHPLLYYCTNHNHGRRKITYSDFQSGRGCGLCANNIRLDIEDIRKEFAVEGYRLLTTYYQNNKQDLEYYCGNHSHGIRKITYDNFRDGHRCSLCKWIGSYNTLPEGATKDLWLETPATLYVVELQDEDERFIKVGVTTQRIENRMEQIPYKYEVINTLSTNLYNASKLENEILEEYAEYKYIPKKEFNGKYECLIKGVELYEGLFSTSN